MTLTLKLRRSIFELVRFSFGFLHFIGLRVHQKVQQRRRQRTLPALATTVEPTTMNLNPTEVETLKVSEQVASLIPLASPVEQFAFDQTGLPVPSAEIETHSLPVALPTAEELPVLDAIGQIESVLQDTQATQAIQPDSLDRSTLVLQILDEAHGRGLRTYAQLIDYVREQSGTGCSKRTIAEWKKQRGLAA